jgi:hypothetical protein
MEPATKQLLRTAEHPTATRAAKAAMEARTAACQAVVSRGGLVVEIAVAIKMIYCCMFGRWCCCSLTIHL